MWRTRPPQVRRITSFLIKTLLVFLSLLILLPANVNADSPSGQQLPALVMVDSCASDGKSLDVHELPSRLAHHLTVSSAPLQANLKSWNLQKGDLVNITKSTEGDHEVLMAADITPDSEPSTGQRFLVLLCCAVGYLVLCWALTLASPSKLVIGEDGHYSNSKLQIALWFGVLISTYVASFILRATTSQHELLGLITIPKNLLLLSGMSALTFAGAKGITTAKVQAAVNSGIVNPKPVTNNPRFLSDLTHNDRNQLDFGDFQMLIVTLMAIVTYVVIIFHFLGTLEMRATLALPDVDSTVLAAFGLGQGAYLTKKAVGNVGDT